MMVSGGTRRRRSATIASRCRMTARSGSGSASGMDRPRQIPCARAGMPRRTRCPRRLVAPMVYHNVRAANGRVGKAAPSASVFERCQELRIDREPRASMVRHRKSMPNRECASPPWRLLARSSVVPGFAPAQEGNAEEGAEVFKKCRACHDVGPDGQEQGRTAAQRHHRPQRRARSRASTTRMPTSRPAPRAWCGPRM